MQQKVCEITSVNNIESGPVLCHATADTGIQCRVIKLAIIHISIDMAGKCMVKTDTNESST